MSIEAIVSRLDKAKRMGPDEWIARCPAHADRSPSLAIRDNGGKILLHCHAGCEASAVLAAIGLSFDDLFEGPLAQHAPSLKRPFSPTAVMECLAKESLIVAVAAQDAVDGKLTQVDRDRLIVATARIQEAMRHG
jgi:hypothetical protein